MPREDDDAGSWCVEDWEEADFDVIPPPYVGKEQWGTNTSLTWVDDADDEDLGRSPWFEDILLSSEREEVVLGSEIGDIIREYNDDFHEHMLTFVLDVQKHHASLVDRLHKSKQGEYFVKVDVDTEGHEIDERAQADDNDVKNTDSTDKRQEMQLLLEDFMKCSFNENFNWDERISRSPAMPKLNEEATAVGEGGTRFTNMSKDAVKGLLKEFTEENITTMKILVEEIKESNEKLVNMLLKDCESTNRCLSELEKDINEIITPKKEENVNGKEENVNGKDVCEDTQKHQDEVKGLTNLTESSYSENNGWEGGLMIDLMESSCSEKNEWEDGLMVDLAESSYSEKSGSEDGSMIDLAESSYSENSGSEDGIMIDLAESSYSEKNGWEEAFFTVEDVDVCNNSSKSDEEWQTETVEITTPNNIKDVQTQTIERHDKTNSMLEDFLRCTYHWNGRISRNSGMTDSLVEISESGMTYSVEEIDNESDDHSTEGHRCDSQPLCRSCTEQQNESNEKFSLQCNDCNSPALCLTCIEGRNQQLVLPTNRMADIWRTYTEPEHIWYPGPWPPLRLSLVEKVKELDAREQDALLIGKWIRMNEAIKPVVYENSVTTYNDKNVTTSIEEDAMEGRWKRMNEKLNEMMDEEDVVSDDVEELVSLPGQTSIKNKWNKMSEEVNKMSEEVNKMSEEVKAVLTRDGDNHIDLDELITWVDEAAMVEQWKRMTEKINDTTENADIAAHDVTDLIVSIDETSTDSQWKKMDEIVSDMLNEKLVVNPDFNELIVSLEEHSTDNRWEEMNKKLNAILDEKDIEEFIVSLDNEKINLTGDDMVIDPDVKELVDSMINKVSSITWAEGWMSAEERYENEWEESDDKIPQQKGADKLINDFGYMWEFLL